MKKTLPLLSLFFITKLTAQSLPQDHISSFNMMSFTYKHNKTWQGYIEVQSRSIEDYTNIDYYETKGGIGYNLNENNQFLLGGGKYGTYKNREIYQNEHRIWLQYLLKHSIDRIQLDHRIRLEKRFFDYFITRENTDTERYRYRFSAKLPLCKSKGGFFLNAYNEIFIAPKYSIFKRNRFFGGLVYTFSENISSNLGYLWQRELNENKNRNLHFIYFSLNFTFKSK